MIQHFFNGVEYTTRRQLVNNLGIPQACLQRLLEDKALDKLVDGNTFYFIKSQVEPIVREWKNKQS